MLDITLSLSILLSLLVFIGMLFTIKNQVKGLEEKQDKYNDLQKRMMESEFKDKDMDRRLKVIEENNNKVLEALVDIKLALIK